MMIPTLTDNPVLLGRVLDRAERRSKARKERRAVRLLRRHRLRQFLRRLRLA